MRPTHYKCYSNFGYEWKLLNWTGRTQIREGGPYYGSPTKFYEGRCFFGLFKFWVDSADVQEFPPLTITTSQEQV